MPKARRIEAVAVPGQDVPAEPLAAGEDPVIAADLKADEEAVAAALEDFPIPTIDGAAPDYVPDQSEIDPAKIPYGQSVMSRQGLVCSTAPDPRRVAQAEALLAGGAINARAS